MLPLARALVSAYYQQSSDPPVEIGKGLGTAFYELHAADDGLIVKYEMGFR